jgi:sugar phosphate isomerase/epimerase
MTLGFCTGWSEERLGFAAAAGFDCLELGVGPGTSLPLEGSPEGQLERVRDLCALRGVEVATAFCGVPHLSPDPAERARARRDFTLALRSCRKLGATIVATNAGGDPTTRHRQQLDRYREQFGEYARVAEGEGVRIAIENCPSHGGYPVGIGNLGFGPELWEALFDAVPSKAIGLEFDPSHLVFLMIDPLRALRGAGDRVFAFHAKDTEVNRDGLARYGCFGRQLMAEGEYREGTWDFGWWRFRIPGWGDLDWKELFRGLVDVGFDGHVIIEHEDPVFRGERHDEGLCRARDFLRPWVPARRAAGARDRPPGR